MPKYEHLLADRERGVSISFERYVEDDEELLEELHLDRKSAVLRLTTSLRNYELDLRNVDERGKGYTKGARPDELWPPD